MAKLNIISGDFSGEGALFRQVFQLPDDGEAVLMTPEHILINEARHLRRGDLVFADGAPTILHASARREVLIDIYLADGRTGRAVIGLDDWLHIAA